MALRIYNTLSRGKEVFEPLTPGHVRMYVCGPTVYDFSHVGHARSVVTFDVLARYLRRSYTLTYVRNFTDVDDKIIRRAASLGESPAALAERFIREFYDDMDALNVERPDFEPRVTESMPDIIALVQRLIEKGRGYVVEGDVFFDISSYPSYGRLSGRSLDEMEAGARVDVDPRKRSPFDFALWKSAKPGEPAWDSPWGPGRPGWHIECSAMSSRLLGKSFDIHGGGKDLIFPHHENEIAQSEGASGKIYARYWIHNGFVNIDHEKMSKSLGNFLTVRDLLGQFHPEVLRLFLISSHYRSPIDFTHQALEEATAGLDRVYGLLERVENQFPAALRPGFQPEESPFWRQFCDAMDDDINTARALGVLFEAVRNTNVLIDESVDTPLTIERVGLNRAVILSMGSVLGILDSQPAAYFSRRRDLGLDRQNADPEIIETLVSERTIARQARDWKRADAIRDELTSMNVVLEDRPDGTVWKFNP